MSRGALRQMSRTKMTRQKSKTEEVKRVFSFLVVCSLPAFINGNGDDFGESSPLQIKDQIHGGADDNNSDTSDNTTYTSNTEDKYEEWRPKEVDHFFLLIMSIIIFFMQCGFAFMEAGAVR